MRLPEFKGVDFNEHFKVAKIMTKSFEDEREKQRENPLDPIRDYAERRNLKPHETLIVSFMKRTVSVERDLRSTVEWTQEYKRTVEKALTPEFVRVIGSMEKSGHRLERISHPDRYSREIDQWAKTPSKDISPILERGNSHEDSFNQGKYAQLMGDPSSKNPFRDGSLENQSWSSGWASGDKNREPAKDLEPVRERRG